MGKLKKLMACAAAILLAASSVFVACSDDDDKTMGPIGINSLRATATSVTLYWTIVPNANCDGYNVSIVEGTRANKGAVVVSQDFDNRTAKGTFTGLKHNTPYVAITKGIPSKTSGFRDAYTYEFEFTTAPLIENITAGEVTYTKLTEEDGEGNEVYEFVGSVTASWKALTGNAGSYTVALYVKDGDTWKLLKNVSVGDLATSSYTFQNIITPGSTFRVGVMPNPKPNQTGGEWYAAGEWQYSPEYTAPAAE